MLQIFEGVETVSHCNVLSFFSSVHQLWVAEYPDEGVCSLALINAECALHESEIPLKSGLLFAGLYNGQISLISGKGDAFSLCRQSYVIIL